MKYLFSNCSFSTIVYRLGYSRSNYRHSIEMIDYYRHSIVYHTNGRIDYYRHSIEMIDYYRHSIGIDTIIGRIVYIISALVG